MQKLHASLAATLLTIAVPIVLAQQPVPGFADPFLGRWDLTVQGAEGPYPSWLEVMLRKETELMGRFVGRSGSNRHVTEITYRPSTRSASSGSTVSIAEPSTSSGRPEPVEGRDGDLLVRIPVQYERNKSDLILKGRLTGDRLEGTTEAANGATLKWTGTRAPSLHRGAPAKWGQPVDLFNGKDLAGWKLRDAARGSCWSVAEGALTNTPPCVDIVTDRGFTDFKLHVEFNIVPKSNSGVYLRGRYEVQIQDDVGKATDSLRMGGVYGFLRPLMNASGRPGEWQTYDITLVGRRVTVVLNGQTIVDDAEIPGITGGALDSKEDAPGPVMLQGDHGKVAFRKVVITPAEP